MSRVRARLLTPLDTGIFSTVDLAIGADGLGLISYFDTVNNDLKVAHCNNTACTSGHHHTSYPTPAGGGTRALRSERMALA